MTPEYLEILVVRELRKVGFEVGQPRVERRSELPEPERGFLLELTMPLSSAGISRRVLVVCRGQGGVLGGDVITSLKARLPEVSADAAIIFTTAEFGVDALAAARDGGVALLQIVDGRSVFDASGGAGGADHYPAWLPAHMTQLVDRDSAGRRRLRVLEAGRFQLILEAIGSATNG